MVQMEEERLDRENNEWISEALDCVKIGFVSEISKVENGQCELFPPDFVHQHFGENETIFGYAGLNVALFYSESSLYIYPEVAFAKQVSSVHKDLEPDNIFEKLKSQLPEGQMDMFVESKDRFQAILAKQANFKPYGEMINQFKSGDHTFELYKVSESDPEGFDKYLERAQTLSLFYIDAAQYTDNTDPLWTHYFLYEKKRSSEGDGGSRYALAGYASLYRFYAYPDLERPRISQIMLLPHYRRQGNGPKLLQSVYQDIYTLKKVRDITVEDPSDNFFYLRDYVDCLNCEKLPEFSPENMKNGFSNEMRDAANSKHKLARKQARRVYEILRLMNTDVSNDADLKAYRIDVKRRLEVPMRRDQNHWSKVSKALDEEEVGQLTASMLSADQKRDQLQTLYEHAVTDYRKTIDRLKTYPMIF